MACGESNLSTMTTRSVSCLCTIAALLFHGTCFSQATRVACIGNSITMGAELPADKSYPGKLGTLLGKDYVVGNFGSGGAGMFREGARPYWDSEEFAGLFGFEPHIVTIMLGTNDSKVNEWQYSDAFDDDLLAIVDTLSTMQTDPAVWLCLPPPAFSDAHGICDSLITDGVIPILKQVAGRDGIPVIDLNTPLRDRPDLYADDGIHLTDGGTTLLAQIIYNALTGVTSALRPAPLSPSRKLALGSHGVGATKSLSRDVVFPRAIRGSAVYSAAGQRLCRTDAKPRAGILQFRFPIAAAGTQVLFVKHDR